MISSSVALSSTSTSITSLIVPVMRTRTVLISAGSLRLTLRRHLFTVEREAASSDASALVILPLVLPADADGSAVNPDGAGCLLRARKAVLPAVLTVAPFPDCGSTRRHRVPRPTPRRAARP